MPSNQPRLQAIQDITRRTLPPAKVPETLESLWATDVFTLSKMRSHLPKEVFRSLKKTIESGEKLDVGVADAVAAAMKEWASAKGALYYAHVFYPLTNATAEKHDGFISLQSDGSVIAEFSGKVLVQGEPEEDGQQDRQHGAAAEGGEGGHQALPHQPRQHLAEVGE